MTFHRPIGLPHSAFTPERRVQFLDILSGNGNVRSACTLTGISPQAAYKARRRDARFAAGWDGALLLAREHAESVLADRAINGVEEVVFYRGEEVGRRVKYDNRLLLALLGRLDRRCGDARAEEAAERFDEILAAIGGAEPDAAMVEAATSIPQRSAWARTASNIATGRRNRRSRKRRRPAATSTNWARWRTKPARRPMRRSTPGRPAPARPWTRCARRIRRICPPRAGNRLSLRTVSTVSTRAGTTTGTMSSRKRPGLRSSDDPIRERVSARLPAPVKPRFVLSAPPLVAGRLSRKIAYG